MKHGLNDEVVVVQTYDGRSAVYRTIMSEPARWSGAACQTEVILCMGGTPKFHVVTMTTRKDGTVDTFTTDWTDIVGAVDQYRGCVGP